MVVITSAFDVSKQTSSVMVCMLLGESNDFHKHLKVSSQSKHDFSRDSASWRFMGLLSWGLFTHTSYDIKINGVYFSWQTHVTWNNSSIPYVPPNTSIRVQKAPSSQLQAL